MIVQAARGQPFLVGFSLKYVIIKKILTFSAESDSTLCSAQSWRKQ